MHTISLTRDNIQGSDNNRMVYDIPGSKSLEGSQMALSNLYMYYSWANINASPLANNQLRIIWPQLPGQTTGTSLLITIPDGLYEVSDVNAYFQQFCITNNLYLIKTTGEYVYFFQMQVNPTAYKLQFNSFSLPAKHSDLGSDYTEPPGGFGNSPLLVGATSGFPGVAGYAPGWQFPANFSDWCGFVENYTNPPGNVVTSISTDFFQGLSAFPSGNTSFLSTVAPNVQPNSVIFVNCNLIQNNYANPSTFLYPVPAKVSSIGGLISIEAPEFSWNQMLPGVADKLIITFTDVRGQPIKILDPNIIVTLIIRDHDSKQSKIGASGPGSVSKSMETLRYGHNPQNGAVDAQHYNQTSLMHRRTNF